MYETVLEDLEAAFPGKAFITAEEFCQFMGCEISVVYNWNRRADLRRRPPLLMVGNRLRASKRLLAKWLADEMVTHTRGVEPEGV